VSSKVSPGPEFQDWLAPERTAVVVVDMQVDFAAPDGALGKAGLDMSVAAPALEAAEGLVSAARMSGVPVIFVGLATDPETDSPVWGEWRRRNGQGGDGALCRAGTRGAQFFGPKPQPGETIVWKMRYSGFFGTGLDAILRARGVDTLVVCGLTTECCVDCTVRDAFHLDYFVYVPADCCAAYDDGMHAGALASLELNCATITESCAVMAAWNPRAAQQA